MGRGEGMGIFTYSTTPAESKVCSLHLQPGWVSSVLHWPWMCPCICLPCASWCFLYCLTCETGVQAFWASWRCAHRAVTSLKAFPHWNCQSVIRVPAQKCKGFLVLSLELSSRQASSFSSLPYTHGLSISTQNLAFHCDYNYLSQALMLKIELKCLKLFMRAKGYTCEYPNMLNNHAQQHYMYLAAAT